MYHFDRALEIFVDYLYQFLPSPPSEVIILRDVFGYLSGHLLDTEDNRNISTELEEKILADLSLQPYCASPPISLHQTDEPLWKKMVALAQPLAMFGYPDKSIKIVERMLEGMSWLQPVSPPFTEKKPFIMTFYSFKGGVGRTTAAALSALNIACQGHKVCLIDLDLEAPGLSGLASKEIPQPLDVGVIDYLLERRLADDNDLPMEDYLFSIDDQDVESKGGELWLMPAGNVNQQYLSKLGRLDFQAMSQGFEHAALNQLFHDLQSFKSFDFYVIDARTGITDIGGLMLNGLSHLNVMLFGLGEQNIQGLAFVLQHLQSLFKKLNLTPEQIARRLLLVFSPVPRQGGRLEDTQLENDLRQTAYDAFVEQIYEVFWPEGRSLPQVNDDETPYEPVPHHPVFIPYLPQMPLQNTLQEQNYIQRAYGPRPYDALVKRILEVKYPLLSGLEDNHLNGEDKPNWANIRQALAQTQPNGAAEEDLSDEDALRKNFLPLPSFRFLFDPKAFLILGRKGSGKTALFQVLQNPGYSKDLATYLELSPSQKDDIQSAEWLVGFSEATHKFLSSNQLATLAGNASNGFYTRFWKYLAVWSIENAFSENDTIRLISNLAQEFVTQLDDQNIALQVDDFLRNVENGTLYPDKGQIYLVYDYLDRMLSSTDLGVRQPYLSSLLDWWQAAMVKNKRLCAKIFLREDIFEGEIEIEDKSKIRDKVQRYTIKWDIEASIHLYRIFLKWSYDILQALLVTQFPAITRQFQKTIIGIVPPDSEETIRPVIEWLVGEYMGRDVKRGYTYTWIPKHLADSKEQIVPRWMNTLFVEAATLADKQNLAGAVIPQKTIRESLQGEVSKIALNDLKTEYKAEFQTDMGKFLPGLFKSTFRTFPQSKKDLIAFVGDKKTDQTPEKVLTDLEEIGLLELRDPTKRWPEEHYQIPDIFLYGLGLTRRG